MPNRENDPASHTRLKVTPEAEPHGSHLQGGFHAVVGNPPWVLYAGKGKQPIDPQYADWLKASYGRAAKTLSTHGVFAAVAGRLTRRGARIGMILPTSVADATRYSEVRAAHSELCAPDDGLVDIGEGAFNGVFQPCMALTSTRRTAPICKPPITPWKLSQTGIDRAVCQLLERLDALPKLPASLFGERGYRSSVQDKGKFTKATEPRPPFDVPLYEGVSVQEFELLGPTAFANGEQLPAVKPGQKWRAVDIFIRQTARYPIACPAAGLAFRNSIIAGFAEQPFTAGALLAYLNSTPVRWYHFHRQRAAQQGMPQVTVGYLRMLPSPDPSALGRLDALGTRLATRSRGITAEERLTLDQLVASALGISGADFERMVTWGQANPPPESRHPMQAGPGLSKADPTRVIAQQRAGNGGGP